MAEQNGPPRAPTLLRPATETLISGIQEGGGGILNSYLQSYIGILQNDDGIIFQMILALLTWLGDNTNIDIGGFEQLLKGAHIVIDGDDGALFLAMCQHFKRVKSSGSSLSKRTSIGALSSIAWFPQSSHYSKISQKIQDACPLDGNDQLRLGHGIIFNCDDDGELVKDQSNAAFDILMGIRATPSEDYAGNSWVQLESVRPSSTANVAKHALAFVKYKIGGKNQGPFGESFYTETGTPYLLKMEKCRYDRNIRCVSSSAINNKREHDAIAGTANRRHDFSDLFKGGRRKSRRNKRKNRKRKTKRKSKRKKRRKRRKKRKTKRRLW